MRKKIFYSLIFIITAILQPLVPSFGVELPGGIESFQVTDERLEKDFSLLVGNHDGGGSLVDSGTVRDDSRGFLAKSVLLTDKSGAELSSSPVEYLSLFSFFAEEMGGHATNKAAANPVKKPYKYIHMTIGYLFGVLSVLAGMWFYFITQQ